MDRVDVVLNYFSDLSEQQVQRLKMLQPLYERWNQKINVVSRKDIHQLYERHILHSLSIAKFINFKPGTKVMDVGTGGGFPGIPVAIVFPQVDFVLIDSIKKKTRIVEDIVEILQLQNVNVICDRVENTSEKADFIISRAVTKITPFYSWTKSKILSSFANEKLNGIILLKGGDLTEELSEFRDHYQLVELKKYFSEPFFNTKKLVYIPFAQ